uniref:Solute carrier family 2 member 9, like 1 n=1 Tax=Xiphophorus couchianus TaxID=32473 RepID=A0A3B5LX71_9TELE
TQGNALLVIIILGCGGSFHTGYHLTGLSSPSPHIQHFINSSWYDRYKESPGPEKVTLIWSLIISMYAVGGLFGAVSVKLFSRKLGKRAMICNSLISVMGAVIMLTSKTAKSFEMIIVARMLYGYSALGASLHSMYLGEISPRKIRGRVTLTSATFTSLGKLSGQFFGLEILGHRDLWNIVLCVPVCFSAVQVLVLPFLPEAPRYLFIEKRDDKACKRLQSLWGKGDYKQEMEEMLIEHMVLEASPPKSPLRLMRDRTVRWQLSQVSTFSFDIFLNSGVPKDKIRYVTLGLGISEMLTSISCTELFTQSDRLAAFVLMGLQRWFMFAMVGLIFPFLIDAFGSYCFTLFAVVSLLGSFYTFFLLPETKGKTLVDISEEFKAITVCGKSFLEREGVETKL